MKQKNLVLAAAVVVVLSGVVWQLVMKQPVTAPHTRQADFTDATTVAYVSDTGATVTAQYVGDVARVQGVGVDELVLVQVVAASGAKYEADGVVAWNKGSELAVTRGDEVLFAGVEAVVMAAEESEPVPASALLAGTSWRWVKTTGLSMETSAEQTVESLHTLSFTPEGLVTVVAPCDTTEAAYTETNGQVTFGVFLVPATLRACEESELGQLRTDWSNATLSFVIEAETLLLQADDVHFTFERE